MTEDSRLGGELALAIFELNGQMLSAGESLARPVGLTVAWWQVLGAVLRGPLTAAGIGRRMGITRQAVQRVVKRLVDQNMLAYVQNPAHKRSPLLTPTEAGRAAVERIRPEQSAFSQRIAESFGRSELEHLISELRRLSEVVEKTKP